MSGIDWAAVSDALNKTSTALLRDPSLNADEALRLAVWGRADAPYPGDYEPGASAFDEAHTLIEAKCGWQGNGIADIPRDEAIRACRDEAQRIQAMFG